VLIIAACFFLNDVNIGFKDVDIGKRAFKARIDNRIIIKVGDLILNYY
jgi:hypothetical protein